MPYTIELYRIGPAGARTIVLTAQYNAESLLAAKVAARRLLNEADRSRQPDGCRVRGEDGRLLSDWCTELGERPV